ncbi:hypothetical protein GQ54DRAFT_311415, partial [Martensiomyces pterosporus]
MSKEHTAVPGEPAASSLEYTSVDAISGVVSTLRESYEGGKLRDLSFRKQQLKSLLRGVREQRKAILDGLYLDLHKSHKEGDFTEVAAVEFELGRFLDNLSKWAKPDKNPLALLQPV